MKCRKTGITLKDTGQRDEHGLEPIDGIFSSPEKSPLKRNGVNHNTTIAEEESMDTGESETSICMIPVSRPELNEEQARFQNLLQS